MKPVRRSVAALISAADIMSCFVGVLFLVLQTERVKIKAEQEQARQEVTAAQERKKEIEETKKKLEEEIDALRKKKWKLIASQWKLGKNGMTADTSLYCLREGVFDSPQSQDPMSDEEIVTWINARPKSAKQLFLYVENGGNDSLLRAQAALSTSGRFENYSQMTLPSDLDPRN